MSSRQLVTVNLVAQEGEPGKEIYESVLVEDLGDRYRLVCSPAFITALAAGDEIELTPDEHPGYRLVSRSGNVSVQLVLDRRWQRPEDVLTPAIKEIAGWLDGKLESANEWLLVYTIPVSSTFAKIEGVMAYAQQKFPGCRWFYGNVYDPKDGTTPLNWWVDLKEADFERLRNINQM